MRKGFSALALALAVSTAASSSLTAGGILHVCDDVKDPLTLDPQRQFSEKNHTIVQQIFEGLVRFDADGRIVPALARRWERQGPLRMRFYLREGVRFHNGEPFDAESVRFSISRYLDPVTGFPALGYINSIAKAEIIDSHTVDIVTKSPDGLLLNRLAGFILIAPPQYIRTKGENALHEFPVGTGPFRYESRIKEDSITLARSPDYWNAGYPKLDGLVFKFIPTEKQMQALKDGEIDLLTEMPGTQTADAVRTGRLKVVKKPSFYTVTGSFNRTQGPLADRRVRRALNHAVNKDDLIRFDLLGNGRKIATVTMPGEEGHNADLKPFSYDPKKALRLLREAGYQKGFSLKVAAKLQGKRAAGIIAEQLARIGVKLDIHFFSDSELIDALARGEWDMFLAGCPDPMSHSFFIQSIFLYSFSPYRVAKDAQYDRRLEEMATILDDGDRRAVAKKLDAYMHQEALLLFLYQRIKTYGAAKNVEFHPSITGMPHFFDAAKPEDL